MQKIEMLWQACPLLVIIALASFVAFGVLLTVLADMRINPEPLECMEIWEDEAYDV